MFSHTCMMLILQCCSSQAKAEAQSRIEATKIEGEAAVEQTKLKAKASKFICNR